MPLLIIAPQRTGATTLTSVLSILAGAEPLYEPFLPPERPFSSITEAHRSGESHTITASRSSL